MPLLLLLHPQMTSPPKKGIRGIIGQTILAESKLYLADPNYRQVLPFKVQLDSYNALSMHYPFQNIFFSFSLL